jgi:hypothetical protein
MYDDDNTKMAIRMARSNEKRIKNVFDCKRAINRLWCSDPMFGEKRNEYRSL